MTEPKWMIDAGAYIGDTSVYFLNRFRDLRVIAIEANPQNYKIARQNLAPYASRCTLLQKGVWKSNSKLRLKNDLNFTYVEEVPREQAEFDLEGIQIDTIMSEHQIPRISILKMDIEGAEAHVFSSPDQNWLSKTDLLIIEIHNAEAFSAVEKALSKLQFRMIKWRSVFYCYK
jgi:FkbM family methyltransferase